MLELGADLLELPSRRPDELHAALAELRSGLAKVEQASTIELPARLAPSRESESRLIRPICLNSNL